MQGTGQGCFVFSWDQVELDGLAGNPPAPLMVGANFRWAGRALRVDDPGSVLRLASGEEHRALHAHAAAQVRRMFGAELNFPDSEDEADGPTRAWFELTDGRELLRAVLVERGTGQAPLVMFRDGLPNPDQDYWVLRSEAAVIPNPDPGAMVCFVPGTFVATPTGRRPVEEIAPGDLVSTRDDGPQEVLWRAGRSVSGGRMIAMPGLRPIRIRAGLFGDGEPRPDLYVSPDHRMLLSGPTAQELFGEAEVLVAARDLLGHPGVTVDNRARPVEYIHLMLSRHQILTANGLHCDSFHPGLADLSQLGTADWNRLIRLRPELDRDPMRFGAVARRLLGRAEAALLMHGRTRLTASGH